MSRACNRSSRIALDILYFWFSQIILFSFLRENALLSLRLLNKVKLRDLIACNIIAFVIISACRKFLNLFFIIGYWYAYQSKEICRAENKNKKWWLWRAAETMSEHFFSNIVKHCSWYDRRRFYLNFITRLF